LHSDLAKIKKTNFWRKFWSL